MKISLNTVLILVIVTIAIVLGSLVVLLRSRSPTTLGNNQPLLPTQKSEQVSTNTSKQDQVTTDDGKVLSDVTLKKDDSLLIPALGISAKLIISNGKIETGDEIFPANEPVTILNLDSKEYKIELGGQNFLVPANGRGILSIDKPGTFTIVNLDAGQDMGSVKVENIVIERLPQRSQ